MAGKLDSRIKTIAELKMMEMDITEYLREVLDEVKPSRLNMEIARLGLTDLLSEDVEQVVHGL